MGYKLVLPPDTQSEIADFILNEFVGEAEQLAAANAIQLELDKLSANPKLGTSPPGPFEGRPIYRFTINVGSKRLTAQATYKVHSEDGLIVVIGFGRVGPVAL